MMINSQNNLVKAKFQHKHEWNISLHKILSLYYRNFLILEIKLTNECQVSNDRLWNRWKSRWKKKKKIFALFLHLFLSVCPFSPFLFLSGPRFSHAIWFIGSKDFFPFCKDFSIITSYLKETRRWSGDSNNELSKITSCFISKTWIISINNLPIFSFNTWGVISLAAL